MELLAVFILLSPCTVEKKQNIIFHLMDFDGSATISKDELVLFLALLYSYVTTHTIDLSLLL